MDGQQCYRTVARLATGQANHKRLAAYRASGNHPGPCRLLHAPERHWLRFARLATACPARATLQHQSGSCLRVPQPYPIRSSFAYARHFARIISANFEFLHSIGNNYAITNESETRVAKVFFAQGCVVDPATEGTAAAAGEER